MTGTFWAKPLRLLGWIAYGGAVAAVFVLAGYLSFNLFVRRGVTTVPDLEAVESAEAESRLDEEGLTLRLGDESGQYDETVPAGAILRLDPPSGTLVKRGSVVEAVVSLGPELVEVPALSGQALQAAQVALSAAGLAVSRTASVYATRCTPGTVVEQKPLAGTRVKRSEAVELYLCLESHATTFLMPDLVYRDAAEVRRFFDRRGVRLGSVKFEEYEGIPPGVVLRQFPLPGHPLRQRDVISLVVTGGERAGP